MRLEAAIRGDLKKIMKQEAAIAEKAVATCLSEKPLLVMRVEVNSESLVCAVTLMMFLPRARAEASIESASAFLSAVVRVAN